MSFFTSNAYASFHQHLPPKMQNLQVDSRVASSPSARASAAAAGGGSLVAKKLSPQKQATSTSRSTNGSNSAFTGDRLLDNASFMSASSTASTASEYDLLSPLHVADPRLLTPTSAASGTSAPSLKVYDQVDDDEEWGEFMNFSSSSSDHAQAFGGDDTDRIEVRKSRATPTAVGASNTSSTRRANQAARRETEYDGWQRLPQSHSEYESSSTSDDGQQQQQHVAKHLLRAMHTPPPYQQQPQAWGSGVQTQSPSAYTNHLERQPSSSSALDTFANAVRSRLASFRSDNKTQQPQSTASWPTRLFSHSDEMGPSVSMPVRGYDSYDVTFEHGPIGLELETDWYGRQAVVKGFKTVRSGEDGPARQCGIIRIGDVLTAIDGESCLEMNFQETLARLRAVSSRRHVLHFTSLETAGDLSVYTSDMDIIQAKRFIHQHKEKFYRPPPRVRAAAAGATASSSSNTSTAHRGLVLGCVERLRGESVTAFNFHREDTGEFVMACSCVNDATGVFIFHTLQDSHLRDFKALPQSEDSAVYLGQMVPNFLGTEFTVVDHQQKRRNELGFLLYSSNVLGRVPNFLKCVFPRQPPVGRDGGDDSEDEEGSSGIAAAAAGGDDDDDDAAQAKPDDQAATPAHRPRAATTGSYSTAQAATTSRHDTMMDRNGSIAERYKHVKQQRQLSLVERLRHFSLDDLDTSLAYASENLDALWHDADDHASHHSRSMRMTPGRGATSARAASPSMRELAARPYGAVEQTEYHCDLLTFETKKPAWNDELGAWTLNFHGRVKMASKNFLLVPEQGNDSMETEFGDDRVILRFGKVSKSRFSLDYQAPISPMLALAIVCSSFAHKIAVT